MNAGERPELKSLLGAVAPYVLPVFLTVLGAFGTVILNDIKGSINDIRDKADSYAKVEKDDIQGMRKEIEDLRNSSQQTREQLLDLKGQVGALKVYVTMLHRDPSTAASPSLPPAD